MIRPAIGVILLIAGGVGFGQDTVRLVTKKLVRGEIIEENDQEVRLIDRMGAIVTIKKPRIAHIRRGRPLKKIVSRRLEKVDPKDPDALMAVAVWCRSKKNERDAKILARRVCAMRPDHAAARAFLGHVRALDHWYPNQAAADAAIERHMSSRGLVRFEKGWVKAEDLVAIQAAPKKWMLVDDLIWRRTAEVMRERGFVPYRDAWYEKDELAILKPRMEELEKRLGVPLQGALAGSCKVFTVTGRESAVTVARHLLEARKWFMKTYEVKQRDLLDRPISESIVLRNQDDLKKFIHVYREPLHLSRERIRLALMLKSLTLDGLSKVIHKNYGPWEYNLVSSMGANLALEVWNRAFLCPPIIWLAAAHAAEIHVFGDAKTQWVQRSDYARRPGEGQRISGRNIRQWRERAKGIYDTGQPPTLRDLFFKTSVNDITPEEEIIAVVLNQYLLARRKSEWLDYIQGYHAHRPDQQFEAAFGAPFETVEHDFKDWLAHPPKRP